MERNISIDVAELHLVPEERAIEIFDVEMGSGDSWASPLMQYRTTSLFQRDWKIEVGNWVECARRCGFWNELRGRIAPRRKNLGSRGAGDEVHRNVSQCLAEAMAVYYFSGTGWKFHSWNPQGYKPYCDIDFQLVSPDAKIVNCQLKASGRLGLEDGEVDPHIQQGIRKAARQLPTGMPALIVVCAQRDWWLSADVEVVDTFIGSTSCYSDGTVLLFDDSYGELCQWTHVSGILVLDLRRGEGADYSCLLVQNPWASLPVDASWFPHSRVLTYSDEKFSWLRGQPESTTFPTGTMTFSGSRAEALEKHGLADDRDASEFIDL